MTGSAPNTMVERVARLICISAGIDPMKSVANRDRPEIGRYRAWMDFRYQARQIIAAMREPTPFMKEAPVTIDGGRIPHYEQIWKSMIDRVLTEGDQDAS